MNSFKDYSEDFSSLAKKSMLQNSLSSELTARLESFKQLGRELGRISDDYETIVNNLSVDTPDLDKQLLKQLESEFLEKNIVYWNRYETLRLIFTMPVYIN